VLDFCADHHVRPEIEAIAPDYINETYEWMLVSDVRYRFAIDTQPLRA
jgi:alcohol dehydrogenase (NADP+)